MYKVSALPVPKPLYVHTMRTMMHKVFVYGTLKRQEPNYHWLTNEQNGHSKFLLDGATKTKYPLIIATKYNIPFLLHRPGLGHCVKGEVYEVDDKMLGQLDILEDHPNYYVREQDHIVGINPHTQESEELQCWVYFLKNFKPELLKRTMMESYSSNGPHGLIYMDRSKRDPMHNYKTEIKGDKDPQ